MNEEQTERLDALCWDAFSKRFNGASRDELERFPKLKAEWHQWRDAWTQGAEAFHSVTIN
jgi:hypothetical protein